MWVLRYQYDLEDGRSVNVSFCVDSISTYSIGRSSKNHLIIKNDKSISREHIQFAWNREQACLWFANIGKLTAINGKYLKPKEKVTFEESTSYAKPIILELGTKPIKVDICWQRQSWSIPPQCVGSEEILRNNGICFNSSQSAKENYNVVVASDNLESNWEQCLLAIVKGAKIMRFHFLSEICEILSQRRTDFDAAWLKLLDDPRYLRFPNFSIDDSSSVFNGLNFCLIQDGKHMVDSVKTLLELGSGTVLLAGDSNLISKKIESEDLPGNLIILALGESRIMNMDFKAYTLRGFVEAVIKGDINSLVVEPSKPKAKRIASPDEETLNEISSHSQLYNSPDLKASANSEIDSAVAPVMKRRRLNRERVKPLDSLMFFAGGDSIISDQRKSVSTATQSVPIKVEEGLLEPKQATEVAKIKKKSSMNSEKTFESAPIAISTRNDLNDLEETSKIEKSRINTVTKGISIANTQTPEPSGEIIETTNVRKKNEGRRIASPNMGTKPLNAYRANQQAQLKSKEDAKDFVQVIHDTKNREVKRLNSSIVQINLEELTDEAINKLGNIALVQENDSLIRGSTSVRISGGSDGNPEWKGRKNFKNFSKALPRYRQNQSGNEFNGIASTSNSIRRSAFLIAREYVPLKKYCKNSNKSNQEIDGFVQPSMEQVKSFSPAHETIENVGADDHSFTFSRSATGSGTNALFVADESDSEMVSFTEPNEHQHNVPIKAVSPPKRKTRSRSTINDIHDGDTDDEEDDDGPKFTFKRRQA